MLADQTKAAAQDASIHAIYAPGFTRHIVRQEYSISTHLPIRLEDAPQFVLID